MPLNHTAILTLGLEFWGWISSISEGGEGNQMSHSCVHGVHAQPLTNSVVTPWTIAHQSPLSMEVFRQEYWSWLPFPTQGWNPRLLRLPPWLSGKPLRDHSAPSDWNSQCKQSWRVWVFHVKSLWAIMAFLFLWRKVKRTVRPLSLPMFDLWQCKWLEFTHQLAASPRLSLMSLTSLKLCLWVVSSHTESGLRADPRYQ